MTDQQPQTAQQPQSLISFNTTAPDMMQQAQAQQVQAQQVPTHQQMVSNAMNDPRAFVASMPAQQAPKPPVNPYQTIIAELRAQNEALMQQNGALSGQITQMVQSGYQVQQPQQQQPQQQAPQVGQNWAIQPETAQYPPFYAGGIQQAPISLTQDVSLESLASEIGKKDGE